MRGVDIPVAAEGVLADFAEAGAIGWSGVHLARTLGRLAGENRPEVLLAVALCLRAQEAGSVCLPLDDVMQTTFAAEPDQDGTPAQLAPPGELPWPEVDEWSVRLAASPLVAVGEQVAENHSPLRLVGRRLYLERNWQAEEDVRTGLLARLDVRPPEVDQRALDAAVDRAFEGFGARAAASRRQREAVCNCVKSWTSVIAGGPGTGKTTTIAQLLRVLDDLADRRTTVALASFTGKAAARMQHSLDDSLTRSGQSDEPWRRLQVGRASTLHSLLGARPHAGFTRNADNPLPYDVLIVDEMSMVSLSLMRALLSALRPSTRLVMVGDPNQLSSVEAGAVLADIVTADLPVSSHDPSSAIIVLNHSHRFSGPIQELAEAIRDADVDRALALLEADGPELEWLPIDPDQGSLTSAAGLPGDLLAQGKAIHAAALAGRTAEALAALDAHRLLCAHRHGRYGVTGWSRAVEQYLRRQLSGYGREGEWYFGRPVLITRNAPELQIANGDTGVVVLAGGTAEVALTAGDTPQLRSPWLLDSATTMHALTVHKSQGSEYGAVSLVLPPVGSPLLTRELLYTAVTRAQHRVRIIATKDAITQAITTRARRATGLGDRLKSQ